jgi:hypothetical protein
MACHEPNLLGALTGGVLAYGPAPGVELIPYFLALLGWIGLAVAALVLSPVTGLVRRLRRGRKVSPVEPRNESVTSSGPESGGEGKDDQG